MKHHSHSNALLVELLIVVLFFMLASTVLLQLFTAARTQSQKAEDLSSATLYAQNIAETLYSGQGDGSFVSSGERFSLPGSFLTASVESAAEQMEAGTLTRYTISIFSGDELVYALPGARYEEVAP